MFNGILPSQTQIPIIASTKWHLSKTMMEQIFVKVSIYCQALDASHLKNGPVQIC